MPKNRLEGAAAEGDGKKKLAAPNSRAGLETTSPGFAVKARNNNGAKAASMVVVEEGKAAAGAVGLATTRTTTTAGSNGGKAGKAYEQFVLQVLEVLVFMTNRLPGRLCIIRGNVPICEVRVWRIFLVFL
jgi:hypothetical protein